MKSCKRGYARVYKKITQFIGLILFIVGAVLTFIALFSTVFQVKNGLNDIKKLELSFNFDYQFTANNLAKDTQYFNATAINKNKNLLYNGYSWRGNNIFILRLIVFLK